MAQGVWEPSAYEKGAKWSGRACSFYYPLSEVPLSENRLLTEKDAAPLGDFADCAEEPAAAQPFAADFAAGQAVSICRGVRKGQAHEAGIETHLPCRGQGHASSALRSAAVLRQGNAPLYSADNVQLAKKNRCVLYAHTYKLY